MDQDRQVQSHQDLRPARLNCNLTEGIKIAKDRICQSKGLSVSNRSTDKMTEREILSYLDGQSNILKFQQVKDKKK